MLFAVRWPSGDISFVDALSKEHAIILLDEIANAEGSPLFRVKNFMLHLKLANKSPFFEFEGFGEDTYGFLMEMAYPILNEAMDETAESFWINPKKTPSVISKAIAAEKERVKKNHPKTPRTLKGRLLQGIVPDTASVVLDSYANSSKSYGSSKYGKFLSNLDRHNFLLDDLFEESSTWSTISYPTGADPFSMLNLAMSSNENEALLNHLLLSAVTIHYNSLHGWLIGSTNKTIEKICAILHERGVIQEEEFNKALEILGHTNKTMVIAQSARELLFNSRNQWKELPTELNFSKSKKRNNLADVRIKWEEERHLIEFELVNNSYDCENLIVTNGEPLYVKILSMVRNSNEFDWKELIALIASEA